jgi:hypothetical protein
MKTTMRKTCQDNTVKINTQSDISNVHLVTHQPTNALKYRNK